MSWAKRYPGEMWELRNTLIAYTAGQGAGMVLVKKVRAYAETCTEEEFFALIGAVKTVAQLAREGGKTGCETDADIREVLAVVGKVEA